MWPTINLKQTILKNEPGVSYCNAITSWKHLLEYFHVKQKAEIIFNAKNINSSLEAYRLKRTTIYLYRWLKCFKRKCIQIQKYKISGNSNFKGFFP